MDHMAARRYCSSVVHGLTPPPSGINCVQAPRLDEYFVQGVLGVSAIDQYEIVFKMTYCTSDYMCVCVLTCDLHVSLSNIGICSTDL